LKGLFYQEADGFGSFTLWGTAFLFQWMALLLVRIVKIVFAIIPVHSFQMFEMHVIG